MSWLRFDEEEVERAVGQGAAFAAAQMSDPRWFHGLDKMFGGRGVADPDGVGQKFAEWVSNMRFQPDVIAARVDRWSVTVDEARNLAVDAYTQGDNESGTIELRTAARGLRLGRLEGWGERLGSMGREWTIWERMAQDHGAGSRARVGGACSRKPGRCG